MTLSLNTWYRIAFPFRPDPSGVLVTVQDDPALPIDHFVLELESEADPIVEKIRMTSVHGDTLALLSNATCCMQGGVHPVPIEVHLPSSVVATPPIDRQADWMPLDSAGMTTITLYFTFIDEYDDPRPCENDQPQRAVADDDPEMGTVGAYPMVFAYPGGEPGPGKKIKVIWKSDI
ncbi:MAG: hypothetical protein KFF77_09700 [Bacteroidetes bacterium]|nr:hypothetical protein [Bacteroidota bacterium]